MPACWLGAFLAFNIRYVTARRAFRRSAAPQKLTENDCYYQLGARLVVSVPG